MEYVGKWLINILIYVIIINILKSILPQNKYTKYMNVFTGLILILIVISPLTKINGLDTKMNFSILEQKNNIQRDNLLKKYNNITKEQEKIILDTLEEVVASQIKDILLEEKIESTEITVKICREKKDERYGSIQYLDIRATNNEKVKSNKIKINKIIISKDNNTLIKSEENVILEKKIKNLLMNFYKIESNNINVSIITN